jgi:hypothetical protein
LRAESFTVRNKSVFVIGSCGILVRGRDEFIARAAIELYFTKFRSRRLALEEEVEFVLPKLQFPRIDFWEVWLNAYRWSSDCVNYGEKFLVMFAFVYMKKLFIPGLIAVFSGIASTSSLHHRLS